MMKDRILLVEDEASLAMIVAETLTDEGFDVDIASDGLDGLGKLARESYGIVVADVMMPRLDGFEMCRRLRRIDPDIPLLFLTAKSSIDDIVDGFELGANDYLKKPFKMRELIVRIKALFGVEIRRLSRRLRPWHASVAINSTRFRRLLNFMGRAWSFHILNQ